MGRLITAALALAVLSFLAYRVVYKPSDAPSASAGQKPEAQRSLQHVRSVGERLEADDKAHLDDIEKKTQGP